MSLRHRNRLDDSENRFESINAEFEAARETAKEAKEAFSAIRKKRCDLFNKAYGHISEKINDVYKDLTKGKSAPMGGVAYLTLEDSEVSTNPLFLALVSLLTDLRAVTGTLSSWNQISRDAADETI